MFWSPEPVQIPFPLKLLPGDWGPGQCIEEPKPRPGPQGHGAGARPAWSSAASVRDGLAPSQHSVHIHWILVTVRHISHCCSKLHTRGGGICFSAISDWNTFPKHNRLQLKPACAQGWRVRYFPLVLLPTSQHFIRHQPNTCQFHALNKICLLFDKYFHWHAEVENSRVYICCCSYWS